MAKILVVEDEPGIALGLEDSLRLEGYRLEVVTRGVKASTRALEEAFGLILLDVMLLGKSGFNVCRDLGRSGLEAPIIIGRWPLAAGSPSHPSVAARPISTAYPFPQFVIHTRLQIQLFVRSNDKWRNP